MVAPSLDAGGPVASALERLLRIILRIMTLTSHTLSLDAGGPVASALEKVLRITLTSHTLSLDAGGPTMASALEKPRTAYPTHFSHTLS